MTRPPAARVRRTMRRIDAPKLMKLLSGAGDTGDCGRKRRGGRERGKAGFQVRRWSLSVLDVAPSSSPFPHHVSGADEQVGGEAKARCECEVDDDELEHGV